MSEENISTVSASYEAYARGDFPAVLGMMDSGIQWVDQESLPWGGMHCGPDDFAKHMQTFAGHFEEVGIEPQEFLDAGDRVVVTGRLAGRGHGGRLDTQAVWIWQLRGGKVVRVDTYTDTAAVDKALGR